MHQQVCDNKGRKQSRRLSYPLLIIFITYYYRVEDACVTE